ncbi:MAG: hypothetical protein ACOYYI_07685 [Chloroflexota bacterium]
MPIQRQLPNLEDLDLENLQRLIERCEDELARRRCKPISEEDALLSLSAQLASHRRQKEQENLRLRQLFHR